MKKTIALITAVLSILLLSGCVSNNQSAEDKNITASPAIEQTTNITGNISSGTGTGTPAQVSAPGNLTANTGGSSTLNASSGSQSGWCTPGSKLNVNLPSGAKVFTVVGETTYRGHDVCRADLVTANGTTTKYFSKDGTFEAMNSTESGKNATAEASTNVSAY